MMNMSGSERRVNQWERRRVGMSQMRWGELQ